MAPTRILVVEDLASLALTYAAHLERAGYEPVIVGEGQEALAALRDQGPFGAMLLDLQLPDTDGLALLRAHPEMLCAQPVVVATADGSLARAIEAMRLGAFDFLVKPLMARRLVAVIESAVAQGRDTPRSPADAPAPHSLALGQFIGTSPAMQDVYHQIQCLAPSRATAFITGESGTGKEVCAEAIHMASGRGGPFVAINCGAIPEHLLESELFGHMRGAFTGAVGDRIGAVQSAHRGTLFLDEICEMALPLQVKLLRFLQTGTVQPVGASRSEPVDVRIVCATNRDPEHEVAQGRFRQDLYYRLAVVPLHMPPLRQRGPDVTLLAQSFLQRFAREEGKQFDPLGAEHLAALAAHPWPGNVREMQNVIRRAAVLMPGPDLPLQALRMGRGETAAVPAPPAASLAQALAGLTLDEVERIAIQTAIDAADGSLPGAARALGVSPSTLYRKRERWGEAPLRA
jgi:two-component system, repressor protein LuxO